MPQDIKPVTCQAFRDSFLSQKLSYLYLLYGNDEYLKNKTAEMIINRAIPPDERDFDFLIYYGDTVSPAVAVESFSTKPFLAEHKVTVIRKFDAMKAADQQKVVDEFIKINDDNVLILTCDGFDTRLKASKQILNNGTAIHCKSPVRADEMITWLNEEAKAKGKRIDRDAAVLFVSKVEFDFYFAANELEKLVLYCHDKQHITATDVQVCTGNSKTYNIFGFLDSVGDKNIQKSFVILQNLIDNKEAPIFIITMLLRFFVNCWKINFLRSRNISDPVISTNYLNDIPAFSRANYLRFSRHYPLRNIPRIFSLLLETDTDLKSLNLDETLIIERMMFRLFAL